MTVGQRDRLEKVVVVGQGYVGLPLAMRAVEVGFDVVGLDLDPDKPKQLAAGRSYIEDVDDDRLVRCFMAPDLSPP